MPSGIFKNPCNQIYKIEPTLPVPFAGFGLVLCVDVFLHRNAPGREKLVAEQSVE